MKTLVRNLLLVPVALAWMSSAIASPQITERITFSTKFPFTVGNTTFPAGTYSIKPTEESEVMEITSADGKNSALFETMMTELPNPASKGEVLFKKYGDSYVLSAIYEAGTKIGAMTLKVHAERQYAKKNSGAPAKESVATARTPKQ